jgi:hypothetical protein
MSRALHEPKVSSTALGPGGRRGCPSDGFFEQLARPGRVQCGAPPGWRAWSGTWP